MRYHIVLNASEEDFIRHREEMQGFVEQNLQGIEEGETVFIQYNDKNQENLKEQSVTSSARILQTDYYEPQAIERGLNQILKEDDICLFSGNCEGAELAVRCGARQGGSSMQNVLGVFRENHQLYGTRMVYSNHLAGKFLLKHGPFCLSIAKGGLQSHKKSGSVKMLPPVNVASQKFLYPRGEREFQQREQKNGIDQSRFLVIGGRGLGNKDAVRNLEDCAWKIGADFGVSRPVAMNAWAPMEQMVGVSGNMCHPDLCITAGVSGAAAFYAGIEKSKCIVAVNIDEHAAIMKRADIIVVDDYKAIMNELAQLMKTRK